VFKLNGVFFETTQPDPTFLVIESSAHAVRYTLRLLVNFLEHKMLVSALFQLFNAKRNRFNSRFLNHISAVLDGDTIVPVEDSDFIVLEVNHLISIANDRCGI